MKEEAKIASEHALTGEPRPEIKATPGSAIEEIRGAFSGAITQNEQITECGELHLEKFGYRDDDTEPKFDGKETWAREHQAITPAGSMVIGVMHLEDDDQNSREYFEKTVLPQLLAHAKKMFQEGKSGVFLSEGKGTGEQAIVGQALSQVGCEQDTWDDEEPFIMTTDGIRFNLNSSIIKKLIIKFVSRHIVEAAIYAMIYGQSEPNSKIISQEAKKYLQDQGIDPDNVEQLYAACFPEDGKGLIAHITDEYNRFRQENMLRKIIAIEKMGKVALVSPGASHAYSLKYVLEGGLNKIKI